MVSLVSQYLDGSVQARDAADSAKKADGPLQQIGRLQNPVKDVFMTFAVELPSDSPGVQAYTQQLQDGLAQFLINPPVGMSPNLNAIANVSAWAGPQKPSAVQFAPWGRSRIL
jgi:hypothetical protein